MRSHESWSKAAMCCGSPGILVVPAGCCQRPASIGSTRLQKRNSDTTTAPIFQNLTMSVLAEKSGPILIIRFARPERRNSLSIDVLKELHKIIDSIKSDRSVEKLILAGTDD